MTVRTNDEGALVTDFFGTQMKTNKRAATFALMPGEGELDYLESEGEPEIWTALVFDEAETAVLSRIFGAAQKLADDQEAVNLAIKVQEVLTVMEKYGQVQEGQAISEEEAKARWTPEGS